jgi:hypothetical protein
MNARARRRSSSQVLKQPNAPTQRFGVDWWLLRVEGCGFGGSGGNDLLDSEEEFLAFRRMKDRFGTACDEGEVHESDGREVRLRRIVQRNLNQRPDDVNLRRNGSRRRGQDPLVIRGYSQVIESKQRKVTNVASAVLHAYGQHLRSRQDDLRRCGRILPTN